MKQIGTVGVDSGLIMISDPCTHFMPGRPEQNAKKWENFCNELVSNGLFTNGHVELPTGTVVQTRDGDGCFSIYVNHDDKGKIESVTIKF